MILALSYQGNLLMAYPLPNGRICTCIGEADGNMYSGIHYKIRSMQEMHQYWNAIGVEVFYHDYI